MNSFSALADPNEPVDPTDVEFFKFTGLVPDAKVSIQNEAFDITKYPATVSLLACASKHGNFAVATVNGFIFSSTKALRSTFYKADKGTTVPFDQEKISVPLSKPIRQLRFTATEQEIVLAVEGGEILVYNVDDIKTQKENAKPAYNFSLSQEIVDLRPNPEEFPHLAAVLLSDNHCKIIDIRNGSTTCEMPIDNATAICWSPKGKQIVCGKADGSLQHFDINGATKDNLPIPQAMSAGNGEEKENRKVQDILWVENHIFLVLYVRKPENDEDPFMNDGYIINRKPKSGTEPLYTRLAEITPIFTTEGRGNHFYMEVIRGLGQEIKHLIVLANAATNETSVVGENEQGEWATWQLPENGIATLPLSEATYVDTYPLGLCLDFSADEKLPPEGDNEKDTEPVPVLFYINDEGHMGAYHCYNIELARRNESYKTEVKHVTMTTPSTQPAANQPSGFSAFGAAAASTDNAFADLLSGKATSPTPPQGSGFGFGSTGGSIPSFSNLGSAAKISTPSGFGFGNTSNKPAAPAFGSSSGFGSTSSFGSTSPSTEAPKKETPQATGSFASFAKNTVPGATTPQSAFGTSSGFGAAPLKTETKPLTQSPTPAFGSTTPLAGGSFASFAKNTLPGATTPKTTFGSPSGFGSSTTNTASTPVKTENNPTTQSPTPAFGSTTPLAGGSFASFAKNTVPGATAPKTTFGSPSGFGTSTTTTQPTASTATTETKSTTTPAFGSTTPVGGFGTPPVTTKPTTTTPTAPPAAAPAPPKVTTPAPAPVVPPTTASTKPAATTEPVKEKVKPVANDGMAKEFEATYFKVTEDLDKLKEYYNKVSLMMRVHTRDAESKSEESLKNPELRWSLNETSQLGTIADGLISKNKQDEEATRKVKENVDALIESCKKLMDKQEDIRYLLGKEVDSSVVDILDNRELDPETKTSLNALEAKVDATENMIEDLELKVQVNSNRNKIKNDHNAGTLSLYSLHRSIRDIEREIISKNKDITELEERLENVKLNDGKGKARSGGYSCGDVDDSEEEEEETISREVIERTTRYIRRYNFLDTVLNETSRRPPLEASSSK